MIVWLYPAAWAGLLAVAGPVIVHLLRRQRAPRMVLPTVRFVSLRDQSAVRLRMPSDPGLLLLRAAIIACAALALARPLFLSDARSAAWAQRTARAVIVDRSDSARGLVSDEAVTAATRAADPVIEIETVDVASSLKHASTWLSQSPPARREIVVLSDFQHGSLTGADVRTVPKGIGLLLISFAPGTGTARDVPSVRMLAPDGVLNARAHFDAERTVVSYQPAAGPFEGLDTVAPPPIVDRLNRVVSRAGAFAPSPTQPVVLRFQQTRPATTPSSPVRDWTFAAGQRLLRTPAIAGVPVNVAGVAGALVIDADVTAQSLEAAELVKAALDARPDPEALAEFETARIPATVLAGWSREPASPEPEAWQHSDESDGRWLWAAALMLLGLESVVRRSAAAVREKDARAA